MEGQTIQWSKDTKVVITGRKWKVYHCILCPSIYGLWLPLWYLLTIAFSVLPFIASDYYFGIVWPLYCLSFRLRLVIITLVSFDYCIVFPSFYGFNLDNRMKNKNTLHHQNSSDLIVKEKTIISMPLMCTFCLSHFVIKNIIWKQDL
jgi:hypothetical protein